MAGRGSARHRLQNLGDQFKSRISRCGIPDFVRRTEMQTVLIAYNSNVGRMACGAQAQVLIIRHSPLKIGQPH